MQIYLAPMEGITTYIYRNIFRKYYGGIDKYFTPFLVGTNLSQKERNEILPENNQGILLVPQILTNQAETFLIVAKQIREYGYLEVNLNLGCPSGTVVRKKRGAGFLDVPDQLDRFLNEIFEKCPMEISIKTRLGIDSLSEWEDLLKIYKKYPVKELIIHTRLQQEFYRGNTHPKAFKEALSVLEFPLCYNGDINSVEAYKELAHKLCLPENTPASSCDTFHQTGNPGSQNLQTIMIGRGAIANPDLPKLLKQSNDSALGVIPAATRLSESANKTMPSDTAKDIKKFQAFHDELLEGYSELLSGDQPVLFRMKELWSYMHEYLNLSDKQLKQLHKINHLSDYKIIVRNFFLV